MLVMADRRQINGAEVKRRAEVKRLQKKIYRVERTDDEHGQDCASCLRRRAAHAAPAPSTGDVGALVRRSFELASRPVASWAESFMDTIKHSFVEFFAGGGMARAGLGDAWRCLFANDFDAQEGRDLRGQLGLGRYQAGRRREPHPGRLARDGGRPRLGLLSLPGPLARGELSRPRPRARQLADAFGHVLAVLEADARPRAGGPRAPHHRSRKRVRLPDVPRRRGFRRDRFRRWRTRGTGSEPR